MYDILKNIMEFFKCVADNLPKLKTCCRLCDKKYVHMG